MLRYQMHELHIFTEQNEIHLKEKQRAQTNCESSLPFGQLEAQKIHEFVMKRKEIISKDKKEEFNTSNEIIKELILIFL